MRARAETSQIGMMGATGKEKGHCRKLGSDGEEETSLEHDTL